MTVFNELYADALSDCPINDFEIYVEIDSDFEIQRGH